MRLALPLEPGERALAAILFLLSAILIGDIAPARTIPAENPSWPALAWGGGDVRLTYLGAAEHGPDALWLVRLPDIARFLLASVPITRSVVAGTLRLGLRKLDGLRGRPGAFRPGRCDERWAEEFGEPAQYAPRRPRPDRKSVV